MADGVGNDARALYGCNAGDFSELSEARCRHSRCRHHCSIAHIGKLYRPAHIYPSVE